MSTMKCECTCGVQQEWILQKRNKMSGPLLAEKQAHSHHPCFCTAYSPSSGVSSTVLTAGKLALFQTEEIKISKIKKGYCE